jgi:hypothetical protein
MGSGTTNAFNVNLPSGSVSIHGIGRHGNGYALCE